MAEVHLSEISMKPIAEASGLWLVKAGDEREMMLLYLVYTLSIESMAYEIATWQPKRSLSPAQALPTTSFTAMCIG